MIYFIDFINKVGPICQELNSLRCRLAAESTCYYYELFRNIDSAMKGYISTADLTETLGLS